MHSRPMQPLHKMIQSLKEEYPHDKSNGASHHIAAIVSSAPSLRESCSEQARQLPLFEKASKRE